MSKKIYNYLKIKKIYLNTLTKLLACSENIDLTLSKTPLKDLSQLDSIKYGLFLRLGHAVLNVNIWQEKRSFLANV